MNDKELIYQLYRNSIEMLKTIDHISIENGMIDTQEYLDWKDDLNTISLDPDRN